MCVVNLADFKHKVISKYIWALILFDSTLNENTLLIQVIAYTFCFMRVSLLEKNFKICWIKISLFKHFSMESAFAVINPHKLTAAKRPATHHNIAASTLTAN